MTSGTNKLRVAILGASGYTGAELVRLLAHHTRVELTLLTADRHAGQQLGDVFPHLGGLGLPGFLHIDEVEWAGIDLDLVFCALPHGTTQEVIAGLLHTTGHDIVDELVAERREDIIAGLSKDVKVIDLSADFRLTDFDTYAKWYGHEHSAPVLQPEAVYGLTEFAREALTETRLIACPGCYPTSSLLPLVPLIERHAIESDGLIIDAKSGVSGAGRSLNEATLFSEVAEGVHPYGIGSHRHAPEIEQEVSKAAGKPVALSFTPHLVPMNRGILATIYVNLAGGSSADDLREILQDRYEDEPFVRVVDAGVVPATRHVRGSNHCLIGVFPDRVPGRAILISAIDNLVKGGSGQAVQNMNIAYGFAETAGLSQEPMFP